MVVTGVRPLWALAHVDTAGFVGGAAALQWKRAVSYYIVVYSVLNRIGNWLVGW